MMLRSVSLWRIKRFSRPATRRQTLHQSARHSVQRLLWAGSVLDQTSHTLKQVPKDWLLALGMQADVEQGLSFNALSASPSHTLLAYTTLPPSLPVTHVLSANDENNEPPRTNPSGLHKIAAIGRNTYGELGAGFASQESTWGMVARGFVGAGGIKDIACGLGTSWVVTSNDKEAKTSNVYSFGNHTSGQLGHGGESRPYALSEGGEPQLELAASPRQVDLIGSCEGENGSIRVEALSSGLDHTLILAKRPNGQQEVYTCGVNTDGQLGDPSVRISRPSFKPLDLNDVGIPPSDVDPIVGIAAGGDTSVLWTRSGRIWSWGNSEYGQALVDAKAIDRIGVPTEASNPVAQSVKGRVVDVKLGGSFVVLLDDLGNVYTAGFGALGQGKERLLSHVPQKILEGASAISAGLEQASAVVHSSGDVDGGKGVLKRTHLAVWGLDSAAGRLSVGVRKPYPSYMIASRFTPQDVELRIYQPVLAAGLKEEWCGTLLSSKREENESSARLGILSVVHGRDAMFVLVEDGIDEVGRWAPKDDDEDERNL